MPHTTLNVFIYRCTEHENTNTEKTVHISSVNVPVGPLQEGLHMHEVQESLQVSEQLRGS